MIPNDSTLTTFDQLQTLVDIDRNSNEHKDIARLFLIAANYWNSLSKKHISEFIDELKKHYGTPLTRQKVLSKPHGLNNERSSESANSFVEIFDLGEVYYKQFELDKILENIFSYYGQQLRNIDFIAELKYLPTDQGGRHTPAFSGYRPQVKFHFNKMQTTGEQHFLNKDIVYPGDAVKATIRLLSVEAFYDCLTEGMNFEFKEGSRLIGVGKITDILNLKLKKVSN